MATNYIKNLGSGTLASAISASTTSLSVYVGEGSSSTIQGVWPSVPFYATIMPAVPSAGVPNSLDSEIVKVTAVGSSGSNTTLTVTRAQRGTTAKAFSQGAIVTCANYAEDAVLLADVDAIVDTTPDVTTDRIQNGSVGQSKMSFAGINSFLKYCPRTDFTYNVGAWQEYYLPYWGMLNFPVVPGAYYKIEVYTSYLINNSSNQEIDLKFSVSGLSISTDGGQGVWLGTGGAGGAGHGCCPSAIGQATSDTASVSTFVSCGQNNSNCRINDGYILVTRIL